MNIQQQRFALRFFVDLQAETGLLIRSGQQGEFTDSTVEKTGDNRLHINGYVWASLVRRALCRCQSWHALAEQWGKYDASAGVAPLWTEATLVNEQDYLIAVNPGTRIDRQWGSVAQGALYSDELAFPQKPLTMRATIFLATRDKADHAAEALLDGCAVIGQGIENIGGGWSYGFGRLRPLAARHVILDLAQPAARENLWRAEFPEEATVTDQTALAERSPAIRQEKGWSRVTAHCRIADGQLLAIHTKLPELGVTLNHGLPDTFVFTRPMLTGGGGITATPVITGKSFRQAILSQEIERRLRSSGQGACLNSSDTKRQAVAPGKNEGRHCLCKRCLWFGDLDGSGILSVGDALVDGARSEIVHRIQVDEHSGQTLQKKLFNGEYLTSGAFTFHILIDHARQQTDAKELRHIVLDLLDDLHGDDNAPAGWYRLGATSTCTGQITVTSVTADQFPATEDRP